MSRCRFPLTLAGSLLVGWCGGGGAQQKSEWEIRQEQLDWREAPLALPAFPRVEDLIEFEVSTATGFRFFVDRRSLAVGADGVVRYTLVARSPAGVENVSFEGMRCKTGEFRVFAFGTRDARWRESESAWRPIEPRSVQRWHHALRREYFCPMDTIIANAAEGVDALRRGGNPKLQLR